MAAFLGPAEPGAAAAAPPAAAAGAGAGGGLSSFLLGSSPQVVGQTAGITSGGVALPVTSAGSQGVLGGLGITAGAGAAPTIGSLGRAGRLGVEGIAIDRELGLLSRPGVPQQIPPPPPQELPLAVQASPLGNDPELIQLLIEAINNSRRGRA